MSWYEHRNDPNVRLTYFEKFGEDTAREILNVAGLANTEEIGSRLISDLELLRAVIGKTSITSLKKTAVPDEELGSEDVGGWDKPRGPRRNFFGKGVIGDWKNHFSTDQERRLKEVYLSRLGGTELHKVWEKYLGLQRI